MKHNKWYIRNGDKKIEIPKKSLKPELGILSNINLLNKQTGTVKKIEARPIPEGSSDCLYTLETTLINFIFFILAEAVYLFNLKQINGIRMYVYPKRYKNGLLPSGNLNCSTQAARRATPADIKIFTLLKVQKPDFSTTGELGNLLLKYAIAFFLLASNLGLLSKLLVNICTFHNKVALHITYNFNTKKQHMEL
jgi:hypothetical protein